MSEIKYGRLDQYMAKWKALTGSAMKGLMATATANQKSTIVLSERVDWEDGRKVHQFNIKVDVLELDVFRIPKIGARPLSTIGDVCVMSDTHVSGRSSEKG